LTSYIMKNPGDLPREKSGKRVKIGGGKYWGGVRGKVRRYFRKAWELNNRNRGINEKSL